jgi:hypothetical protein
VEARELQKVYLFLNFPQTEELKIAGARNIEQHIEVQSKTWNRHLTKLVEQASKVRRKEKKAQALHLIRRSKAQEAWKQQIPQVF